MLRSPQRVGLEPFSASPIAGTSLIGVMAYRLWRWWHSLTGSTDG